MYWLAVSFATTCEAYPDAQIDYLVYASTTPVLEGNTAISNLILFTDKHRNSNRRISKTRAQNPQEKIRPAH
jgi:heptosyltransferase-2